MKIFNELMKCFTPVFGGAVSGGIWVYGVIEKAPMLITVGCVLFGLDLAKRKTNYEH